MPLAGVDDLDGVAPSERCLAPLPDYRQLNTVADAHKLLPPAAKLLVEFAEKRGLFDEKKKGAGEPVYPPAKRKEWPQEMAVEELLKLPEREDIDRKAAP